MSKSELDDLAAEVGADDRGDPEAAEPEAPPAPELPKPEPALVQSCNMLVAILGEVLCARFKVPSLSSEEIAAVGGAGAQVAACYDLTLLDPKTAAWIGLGGATLGVVYPRWRSYQAGPVAAVAAPEGAPGATNGVGDGEPSQDVVGDGSPGDPLTTTSSVSHDPEGPDWPGKKPGNKPKRKRGRKT